MATVKRFTLAATSGSSPVLVLRRGSDGYVRDDSDGLWKAMASCVTPYVAMSEAAGLTGLFTASISGEVWQNDIYTALFYASSAMSEAPAQTRTKQISGDYAADPGGAVTLVEYALCTLQQVKSELNIAIGDTDEDDRISRAINDATDRIETVTNRRLMKRAASVEEFHDCADEDEHDSSLLWTREYPIESKADIVSLEYGSFASRIAVEADDYDVDRSRVIVVLGWELAEGTRAIRLVYRPGYTTAPHDLQGVAINLAQRLYWAGKRVQAGDSDETAGGVTRRAKAEAFSAEDQLVVDAYKRTDAMSWKNKTAKNREWVR